MTCALNVERVKKEEYERKERRHGKKNPGQSSSYQHQSKKFRGPQGSDQPTTQGPPQTTGSKTILPAPSVSSAPGGSSRGSAPPYCTLHIRVANPTTRPDILASLSSTD